MKKYLTLEGLEKIKKELDFLKKIKRREIAERIKYAADFGDLKENAAYEEAKEDQAFLEGKILELEEIVRSAVVQESEKTGLVQIGSLVSLSYDSSEEKFQVVGATEANPFEGKISCESPLGKTLLGKKTGNVVEINAPGGKVKYKILKVE